MVYIYDGLMLFLGTLFAPIEDRVPPGQDFSGIAEIVTKAIPAAMAERNVHPAVFPLIQGGTRDAGQALVRHPLITAVGFTGSLGLAARLLAAVSFTCVEWPTSWCMGGSPGLHQFRVLVRRDSRDPAMPQPTILTEHPDRPVARRPIPKLPQHRHAASARGCAPITSGHGFVSQGRMRSPWRSFPRSHLPPGESGTGAGHTRLYRPAALPAR